MVRARPGPRALSPVAPLPAVGGERQEVSVEGHRLVLSHLSKVLYPATATTKADVLSYYAAVAPVLLPHLAGRPVTLRRAPDGAGGQIFFQKNLPAGAPNWVRTITVPRRERGGDDTIDYPALDSLAALMWAVNLAALELHVPQWQVDARARPRRPDLIVFDLDPGPGAGVAECAAVAGLLRAALGADGLDPVVKTSGSKGLQLYARVGRAPDDTRDYAHRLAQDLERAHPDLVVSTMAKARRVDRVLIDWSQNSTTKTTVAPYSLRIREAPTVSAPVTWDEVEGAATGRGPDLLALGPDDVRARLESGGDLFAPLLGGGGQAVARSRSARKTASSSRSRS